MNDGRRGRGRGKKGNGESGGNGNGGGSYGPYGSHLPHSDEAEAGILGGIILRNDALALIDTIEVQDFYDHRHKLVFQAIRNLEAAGRPIDIVTLENEIQRTGKLDAIGGVGFLGELTLRVPTVDNVVAYADIIKQHRITRDVLVMTSDVIAEAADEGRGGEDLVSDLTAGLLAVTTSGERKIFTMAELIAQEAKQIRIDVEDKLAGKHVSVGIPTGFTMLDQKTGGNPRGVPVVVMARPGCGKTTVAMAWSAASDANGDGESLLATYEDGPRSFAQRGIGQESHLETERLRARTLRSEELTALEMAVATGSKRTESILPAAGLTVEQLVRRVRRENLIRKHNKKKPFAQLLVDYLQNMPQPAHAKTRDEGIAYICAVLAGFAQQEDMAVVIFSQLNREVERREDKRPQLSDARESGAIEQVGKIIYALYRPWLYEPEKRDKATGLRIHSPNDLYVLCLKNNQGESLFDIKLFWDVKYHRIYNSELESGASRLRKSERHEQPPLDQDMIKRFDDASDWHNR